MLGTLSRKQLDSNSDSYNVSFDAALHQRKRPSILSWHTIIDECSVDITCYLAWTNNDIILDRDEDRLATNNNINNINNTTITPDLSRDVVDVDGTLWEISPTKYFLLLHLH